METCSNDFLLLQLEKALIKYGQADAIGAAKQRLAAKGAVNKLAKELIDRGVVLSYVREIQ